MTFVKAIGIDLGTSSSRVAIWQNERTEIIANNESNRITPSCVAFNTERLIGEAAIDKAATNPRNTVFNSKRLLGRMFDDAEVQVNLQYCPVKVTSKDGKPLLLLQFRGVTRAFAPEEISAMILHRLKDVAQSYLRSPVTRAVISVPAGFNLAQRQATKDAGTIAGLDVLRVVDESTLSAVAYGRDRRNVGQFDLLVFNFGSGAVGVSLLTVANDIFEVKASAGTTQLGGEDVDSLIVEYFVQEFQRKHKRDLWTNARSIRRLRDACERAKRQLSFAPQTTLEVLSLFEDIDFHAALTRTQLEDLCADLFKSTLVYVDKVLKDSRVRREDVDEVVLAGGSTRIPRVVKLLSDYFSGKELRRSPNLDDNAAYGAALLADIFIGGTSNTTRGVLLLDAAPTSIGIRLPDGSMAYLIRRNTTIPTMKSDMFFTEYDNQPSVNIDVYEGECAKAKDNKLLSSFILPMSSAPMGSPFEVTLDYDAKGRIEVIATDKATGNRKRVTLSCGRECLAKEEVQRMVKAAERYNQEDVDAADRVAAYNAVESYAYHVRHSASESPAGRLRREDIATLEMAFNDTMQWLDSSQDPTREECDRQLRKLQGIAVPIMSKV